MIGADEQNERLTSELGAHEVWKVRRLPAQSDVDVVLEKCVDLRWRPHLPRAQLKFRVSIVQDSDGRREQIVSDVRGETDTNVRPTVLHHLASARVHGIDGVDGSPRIR